MKYAQFNEAWIESP